ncbi:hypothetical protein EGR_00527 [Echinococcus granulosus]|uniref:Uncharacterized protein n=1 Tax=Echinococcus granulosus TaxID=6210 RepID=W6V0Z6_ECHGR|nr:hypothetical protein EGR_00527 [Echinococcus granulosus]EUB64577.1 hypothetical protein EGR_00527 [Echinococcus granulosus]
MLPLVGMASGSCQEHPNPSPASKTPLSHRAPLACVLPPPPPPSGHETAD